MTIPATVEIPLEDGAYQPDDETLRKTFWLHRRHTSVTYISRMVEMLEPFTTGFAAYVAKFSNPGSVAGMLSSCYACLDELKEGLARLRRADHGGFKLLREGMSFRDSFYGVRADDYEFGSLGRHEDGTPSEALWAWMEKIIPMSGNIIGALGGKKNYPLFNVSNYFSPEQLPSYPPGKDVFIKDGYSIPVTGVWQPISLKGGCPNFLVRGEKAPKANLPILRAETPARHDPIANIDYAARVRFELGEFPTRWQLMWEDDRWRKGVEPPGEREYLLDPATEFPKDPPVALRDPPKIV